MYWYNSKLKNRHMVPLFYTFWTLFESFACEIHLLVCFYLGT